MDNLGVVTRKKKFQKMHFVLFLLLGVVSTTMASPIAVGDPVLIQAHNEQETINYRLEDHVVPIHYDIHLTPYFAQDGAHDAFTFEGVVKILINNTLDDLDHITLHANRLSIGNWWVYPEEGTKLNPLNDNMVFDNDSTTHKLDLVLTRPLSTTLKYVIEIEYIGELANDMYGFYRSYYSEDGVTKWLASTQFQATSARRAFPCFDEPKFKATFQLTMDRPVGYQKTISNTRIIEERPLPSGRTQEVFGRTPKMSSYLLAFVVSEYVGRSNEAGDQTTYSRSGALEQSVYAVNFSDAILKEFDTYTNYPYLSVDGIEKLDQAAIPDFSAGAMENWGLMTYREMLLLVDPSHTTTLQKQRIAAIISHEVAHQWFGDLVTCEWWDNTWLNEGFASFFQYFATHWVEDQWELDLQFIVEQHQSAFQMDALASTHAMTNPVNSPAQISANFNNINYNKAASVLRMMAHIMGPNIFRNALRNYLRLNAFGNTRPGDLMAAFQTETSLPNIGRIMAPWVTQPGYPYITVSIAGAEVTVTQKRFLVKDKDHTDTAMWPIAITFATTQSEFTHTIPQQFYFKEDGAEKRFNIATAPAEYFIVNNQQTGYYRVNYDEENWSRIRTALYSENHGGIHVANRAQIVDDLFNFARAGIVDYSTALDILGYIKAEKSYTPWLAFFNGLTHVTRRIVGDTATEEFSHFILQILSEIYENLGYEARTSDTHTQILLRNHVLNWACRYGHEDCLEKTRAEYARFVMAPNTHLVNPDHRAIVYCQGLRDGDLADLMRLWERYLLANVAHEQITIINAMGCTRTPERLNVFLNTILTDAVRYQDKGFALTSALSGNPENVDVVFDYLIANYETWANNFGFNGMASVASAFNAIADRFTRPEQVTKLNAFLAANQQGLGPDASQSIRNAVTEAEWQMDWAERNSPNVLDFLVDRRNSATTPAASCLISTVILAIVMFVR